MNNVQNSSPRVKLEPNVEKIIEAVSFLLHEAGKRRTTLSQYEINKSIFLADRAHLNIFGRPVTFDNYVAMKDGPVPSLVYYLLKENASTLHKHNIEELPWIKTPNNTHFLYSLKNAYQDKDVLSESDKKALADALTIIKGLTFPQIRILTHNDAAYIEAWRDDSTKKNFEMSYGMLFDSPNFEAAEHVEFLSKHLGCSSVEK